MRVGIFGGTFDPIHKGHEKLAKEMANRLKLDKIIIIPAFVSPFKVDQPPKATSKHRLNMLKLAFEDFSIAEISSIETERKSVSYTVDTVKSLKKIYHEDELFLILSDKSASGLKNWKDLSQIKSMCHVVVALPEKKGSEDDGVYYEDIKTLDVSSTEIRRRLLKGLSCKEIVSRKVLDYINQYDLYWD